MMQSDIKIPEWMQQAAGQTNQEMPQWLQDYRKDQWHEFSKQGLPTRKLENWKYANLNYLNENNFQPGPLASLTLDENFVAKHRIQDSQYSVIVLENGVFRPELSDLSSLVDGLLIASVRDAMSKHEEIIKRGFKGDVKKHPLLQTNHALFFDGLLVYVPKGIEVKKPIHLLNITSANNQIAQHCKNFIIVDENARLTIFEEHLVSQEMTQYKNLATYIEVEKNAVLELTKFQNENKQTTHIAYTKLNLQQDSQATLNYFSKGALFAREDLQVEFLAKGAHCAANGYYAVKEKQYVDYHLDYNHLAPNTSSEMLFKGVLDDAAKAVFNGRLHVQKDAQKINARQANHHILMSQQAQANSKPELEIYADDVKCQHGATTGQLDQDALFFLRARGIDHEQAVSMLLSGFAEEVLKNISCPMIKSHVLNQIKMDD